MATSEVYRKSTICQCLLETLNEMVAKEVICPNDAFKVQLQFYKSMPEALESQVKSNVKIKGHLHTYRYVDDIWTFILKDALIENEDCRETFSRVEIMAQDSKQYFQKKATTPNENCKKKKKSKRLDN